MKGKEKAFLTLATSSAHVLLLLFWGHEETHSKIFPYVQLMFNPVCLVFGRLLSHKSVSTCTVQQCFSM